MKMAHLPREDRTPAQMTVAGTGTRTANRAAMERRPIQSSARRWYREQAESVSPVGETGRESLRDFVLRHHRIAAQPLRSSALSLPYPFRHSHTGEDP
jgi:hypothetical protein